MKTKLNKVSKCIALILFLGAFFVCYHQTTMPAIPSSKDMPSYAPLSNNIPTDVNKY